MPASWLNPNASPESSPMRSRRQATGRKALVNWFISSTATEATKIATATGHSGMPGAANQSDKAARKAMAPAPASQGFSRDPESAIDPRTGARIAIAKPAAPSA